MAGQTIIIGNWNDTTPAAPAGNDNVKFQKDASSPPNISAYVPRATTSQYGTVLKAANAATFLIGIGAPMAAANNVAPPYRVKQPGTIQEIRARAKAALDDDVELMLRRIRQTSPPSDDDILSANLTIGTGSTAWEIVTAFAIDDLDVDDELELDIVSGDPENVTIELIWN